ncbi:co-chaperone GrpE [Gleimia coleocanis DSM 15436]|uniref:Protein GrpE n=1 Tax=Gleimia coleocanis DSM 15436 TaxID=525245 RepID=C0VYB9_9ACTO|nr:nucleotide exchange factor GrpE [Gleimia coleocanis]EEH64422.1 co-chaperone GrpE [Gleimia coleocanis DSM 15436]
MENTPENNLPEEPVTSAENPAPAENNEDLTHLEAQLADVEVPELAELTPEAELEALRAENAQLNDDLARSRADYYNLDQQYNNYVRRSKTEQLSAKQVGKADVVEAMLSVLDDIEAARQAGDLTDGPFASIAAKLEQVLENRYAFKRFGVAGDPFDPQFHEAVMATPAEVEVETVLQVVQSGYQLGDTVLRPAKVIVANPQ